MGHEWGRLMFRKRLLLFSILFSILAGSLVYYVVPRVFTPPLRKDPIPSGAYIVPWMKPTWSFKALKSFNSWDIDTVMAHALKLNITFRIEISALNETRVIPSTVYLGHDEYFMYVGGKFPGMGKNPANTATSTFMNYFNVYFDVANDGLLTLPESASHMSVAINPEADLRNETDSWRYGLIWSYDDLVWSQSYIGRMFWQFARDYYDPKPLPASTLGDFDTLYDKDTGTLIIFFSRHLWRSELDANALQMKQGERWTMGFIVELGYDNWAGEYQDCVDGWPRKIYPYLSDDSSWWPKLVIDLSNPPPEFST